MSTEPKTPEVNTLTEYQEAARFTAIYPKNTAYPFLGLCGEAGECAELAKKCLRDANGIWDFQRLEKLKLELGDVLWYIANIAADHGLSMREIAQANVEKLYSRKARGTIQGSGDVR